MRFKLKTSNDNDNKKHDKKSTQSTLTLNTTGLFQDNRIRLRCFAEIALIYKASASIEITEDGPYISPITGDASPHSGHTNGSSQMAMSTLWSHRSAVLLLSLILGLLLGTASTR